jgi:hypothetical protein
VSLPCATACIDESRCIPGRRSLEISCQFVAEGEDSIIIKGLSFFIELNCEWNIAVSTVAPN